MESSVFWLYFINSTTLIIHEIESAYWKEWELFKLPGGLTGFLILHFPLTAVILFGLIEVYEASSTGYIISVCLSVSGIFAFTIHTFFIKKGRREFTKPVSYFILFLTLIVSVLQLITSIYILLNK